MNPSSLLSAGDSNIESKWGDGPEATQSIDIRAFVARDEIDPMLFDTPYYLEPEKKGRRAYALLRDALVKTGKFRPADLGRDIRPDIVLDSVADLPHRWKDTL